MQCRTEQSRQWSKRKHGDRCNVESLKLGVEEGVLAGGREAAGYWYSAQEGRWICRWFPSDVDAWRVAVCVTGVLEPSREVRATRRGGRGGVSEKEEGRGRGGRLGLVRIGLSRQVGTGEGRTEEQRQEQERKEGGREERIYRSPPCVSCPAACLSSLCVSAYYFFPSFLLTRTAPSRLRYKPRQSRSGTRPCMVGTVL